MTNLDKAYTATARFGAVSDTLDAEGEITYLDSPAPSGAAIRDALPLFTGDLLQVPPMASALKREASASTSCTAAASASNGKPVPSKCIASASQA